VTNKPTYTGGNAEERLRMWKAPRARISGSLEALSIGDLVQLLELSRRSAVISITHDEVQSWLWCSNGAIIDARSGPLSGEAAVYRVLAVDRGLIEAELRPVELERRVFAPTQHLLLEAARRKDETRARSLAGPDGLAGAAPPENEPPESRGSTRYRSSHELDMGPEFQQFVDAKVEPKRETRSEESTIAGADVSPEPRTPRETDPNLATSISSHRATYTPSWSARAAALSAVLAAFVGGYVVAHGATGRVAPGHISSSVHALQPPPERLESPRYFQSKLESGKPETLELAPTTEPATEPLPEQATALLVGDAIADNALDLLAGRAAQNLETAENGLWSLDFQGTEPQPRRHSSRRPTWLLQALGGHSTPVPVHRSTDREVRVRVIGVAEPRVRMLD
jgi:hypothetical protein